MTNKTQIIIAVFAVGLLGSIAFASQDISAQKGADLVIYEKTKQANPDKIRMQEIVNSLENEELAESEKEELRAEAEQIRQKVLSSRPILSAEKQAELARAYQVLEDKGALNVNLGNDKMSDVLVGFGMARDKLVIDVHLSKFSEENIPRIISEIRNIVGDKVDIELQPSEVPVHLACSQTGDCNPLQGGVSIEGKNHNPCSSTFQAFKSGVEGFVTAGHCVDTGSGSANDVFQPTEDFFGFNKMGDVLANAFDSDTKCDCAFVDASESISDLIYNNIAADVVGTVVIDDFITMKGKTSLSKTGQVSVATWSGWIESTYHRNHFKVDELMAGGDSGGPAFEAGANAPDLMGIVSGAIGADTVLSKAEYLDDEISGASFNFS